MRGALTVIIEKILKIDAVHIENLPDKIQITQQKEVDLLLKITDRNGEVFILHVEIQSQDEPNMAYRMLEYRIMAQQVYGLPVRQYVIYLGEKTSAMPTSIEQADLKFRYRLISLNQLPYQIFLSSNRAEEKILAVLASFGNEDPQHVIQSVIEEVMEASQSDFTQNQYLQQLRIIIQLRNLDIEFNKAMETVAKFFKEERDPLYIKGALKGRVEGKAEGKAEGKVEGKAEGKIEGKLEGKVEIVSNLLKTGRFTVPEIANFANVDEDFVIRIRKTLDPGDCIRD